MLWIWQKVLSDRSGHRTGGGPAPGGVLFRKEKTLTWTFLLWLGLVRAEEAFSPEGIYRFAQYLYDRGEYLRAAGEFQRYLFLARPGPVKKDSVLLRIGLCYRKAGKFDRALRYFKQVGGALKDEARYQAGLCYMYSGNYDTVAGWKETTPRTAELIFAARLLKGQWERARAVLPRGERWEELLRWGCSLPRKSPVLAGLLSATIPGAGKFYCDRPWDGLYSFLTVGAFVWQSYIGFKRDGRNSIRGWAFGIAGGVFYLGNIYGSAAAARLYNRDQWGRFRNAVLDMVRD